MCAEIKERAEGNIEFKFPGLKLKIGSVPALAVMMLFGRLPRWEYALEALQNSVGDPWSNQEIPVQPLRLSLDPAFELHGF